MVSPRKSCRLKCQAEQGDGQSQPPPPPAATPLPPQKKLTEAERCRLYRQKRKENPEVYAAYLEKNRKKCQEYRDKMDETQRAEYIEKGKQRVSDSRKRKAEEKTTQPKKRVTRTDVSAQAAKREKWRLARANSRALQHWKTTEAINRKRRGDYAAKKIKPKSEPSTPSSIDLDERTGSAQRKALQRAKASLPQSPTKYVHTVEALIHTSTPRKKLLFYSRNPDLTHEAEIGRNFIKTVRELRAKQFVDNRNTRKIVLEIAKRGFSGTMGDMALLLNVNKKTLKRHAEGKKSNQRVETNAARNETVVHFLEETATVLPDKKLVSKKTGTAASFLQRPLRELHKDFTTAGGNIPFSSFAKCRPSNVRLMSQAKLRQCLCEYCTNVSLKLDTVKAVATQRREYQCVITNERAAVRIITCDPKQKSCCYSTCQQCSADLMDVYLQPLRDADQGDLMKWYRWENQMRVIRGQPVSRKCLVTKVGDLATLLEELKAEVKFLSQHLFRADWQHRQFTTLRNATPFPQETVMMVLDFAENFTCQYQQEVQAAHWHHDTVTLHPIVAYYKCPACETTTTESLVFISNDGKHDFHAVQAFMVKTVDHLQQERGLTINHIVQWTDGCAAQYKSKGPFADISRALEDFGATLERNFFGSRHGKGPSDGESAVVKNHMMTAIVAENAVVTSAEDVYNYLQGSSLRKPPPVHGCSHFLRTFFWVPEGTINRDRPDRPAKTVKGTRMFHSVKCVEQGQIQSRHLTCTCHPCMSGIGDCTFLEVVGPWSSQTLCPQARQRQPCVPQPRRQQPRARRQQPPGRRQQPRARRVIVLPDVAEPASPPPSDNDEHASPAPSDHDHASPPPSEHDEPASPAPYDHAEPASPAHDEPAPSDHDEPASPASYDHVESASPAHDEPVNADHDEPASPAHDEPDSAEPAIFMDLGVPVNTAPSAMDQEGITAPKRTVTKGDWLRVVFHSSKGQSAMEYVAKVLDTDGTETFVSCLRPPYTPRSKQFTYPKEPDETWISRDQITAFLGHPSISRDAYSFDSL